MNLSALIKKLIKEKSTMKKHVTRKKVYGKLIGVCKGMLFAAGLFTGALTGLLWKMEALAGGNDTGC